MTLVTLNHHGCNTSGTAVITPFAATADFPAVADAGAAESAGKIADTGLRGRRPGLGSATVYARESRSRRTPVDSKGMRAV